MGVQLCKDAQEVAENCDAVVLVTEWNEYRDLEWEQLGRSMRQALILDGRHILDREKLEKAGFRFIGIN